MSSYRLSDFATGFGLPRISRGRRVRDEEWTTTWRSLRSQSMTVRDICTLVQFLQRWNQLSYEPVIPRPPVCPLTTSAQEAASILTDRCSVVEQELDHLTEVLHETFSSSMSDTPSSNLSQDELEPSMLIRSWTQESESPYDPRLGFRCSGWRECDPVDEYWALRKSRACQLDHIKAHCEQFHQPTHWISFSDNVSWILKRVNARPHPSTRIAILDLEKLKQLRILWQRSDVMVKQQGGETWNSVNCPNGIKFAWAGHYLVYGWVPSQCIVRVFDLDSLR